MESGSSIKCTFSSENRWQSLSKESMDHIKNVIIQQEKLFKEQVQALHNLYHVQKSAMQEKSKMVSYRSEVCNSRVLSSLLREKYLEAAKFNAQDYVGDSLVIAMHPICADKEFEGSGHNSSFCVDSVSSTQPNAPNKLRRKIDLERLPDAFMEESDFQNEANNFQLHPKSSFQKAFQPKKLQSWSPDLSLPSLGSGFGYEESNTLLEPHAKQPSWSLQQLEAPHQVGCSSNSSAPEPQETSGFIAAPGVSFQSSLTHKSEDSDTKTPNNPFILGLFSSRKNSFSEKYPVVCEAVLPGPINKVEGTKLGPKETFQFSNDDFDPSPSSMTAAEDLGKSEFYSNGKDKYTTGIKTIVNCSETKTTQEELGKEENKDEENCSTSDEACEIIAANILLSFAPSISHRDTARHCFQTQIAAGPNQSSKDTIGHVKKRIRRARSGVLNHKNAIGTNENDKMTKSIRGRRWTSRR